MANTFEINLDPDAWIPHPTAHPDRGVVRDRPYWAFDAAADEIIKSKAFRMPSTYTGSGSLKLDVFYAMASATSGSVDFHASIEAITSGDAFDTDAGESFAAQSTASQAVPGTAGYMSVLTITIANTDSAAAGDMVRLTLVRDGDDATNDTAPGDCRVYTCCFREET